MDSFTESLASEAKRLRVYMTHSPNEPEFMPVLSYRVDQLIAQKEREIAELKALRDRYSA